LTPLNKSAHEEQTMTDAATTLKPFSVIGIYTDGGQIVCTHVLARDSLHAFAEATKQLSPDESFDFVSAHPGYLEEDRNVFFPGEYLVNSETVLAQPDVFGCPCRILPARSFRLPLAGGNLHPWRRGRRQPTSWR
jgi:hypothetical protein